jgi:hypothetical protein
MYTYKIYNNIAKEGIDHLESFGFKEESINPDALLIRSHLLIEDNFNNSIEVYMQGWCWSKSYTY